MHAGESSTNGRLRREQVLSEALSTADDLPQTLASLPPKQTHQSRSGIMQLRSVAAVRWRLKSFGIDKSRGTGSGGDLCQRLDDYEVPESRNER